MIVLTACLILHSLKERKREEGMEEVNNPGSPLCNGKTKQKAEKGGWGLLFRVFSLLAKVLDCGPRSVSWIIGWGQLSSWINVYSSEV